jgi:hypothetical protein
MRFGQTTAKTVREIKQIFFAGATLNLQSEHEEKMLATSSRNSLTAGPLLG